MIAPERTVLILLAAGRSTRFGAADKLHAPLGGKPLFRHAVDALAGLPFLYRVSIGSDARLALGADGYKCIINPAPELGLSRSLALGVGAAQRLGAAAMLVALADMPFVRADHVARLFAAADGAGAIVASTSGAQPMPPALFAAGRFAELVNLSGDHGARALLGDAALVMTDADDLTDIDTAHDLARAQTRLSAASA